VPPGQVLHVSEIRSDIVTEIETNVNVKVTSLNYGVGSARET
jgi:hypothetical protein